VCIFHFTPHSPLRVSCNREREREREIDRSVLKQGRTVNHGSKLLSITSCLIIVFFYQLDAQILYFLYIYYIPLHVSSTIMLILRRSNCISTASGIVILFRWCSVHSSTCVLNSDSDDTRCCTNTIWPLEDEHNSARNM